MLWEPTPHFLPLCYSLRFGVLFFKSNQIYVATLRNPTIQVNISVNSTSPHASVSKRGMNDWQGKALVENLLIKIWNDVEKLVTSLFWHHSKWVLFCSSIMTRFFFVPASSIWLLFCSGINNIDFVLFRHQQHGFCLVWASTTWLLFWFKKHRKNCECCPGHYLSTSVY